MKLYTATEYESGWYVERPDEKATLESCEFIQVAGPFKKQATALKRAEMFNESLNALASMARGSS